jgi:hypothetical protein
VVAQGEDDVWVMATVWPQAAAAIVSAHWCERGRVQLLTAPHITASMLHPLQPAAWLATLHAPQNEAAVARSRRAQPSWRLCICACAECSGW